MWMWVPSVQSFRSGRIGDLDYCESAAVKFKLKGGISRRFFVILCTLLMLASVLSSEFDYDYDNIGNRTAQEQYIQQQNHLFILKTKSIKIEVLAVLPDSSNESFALAKALNRALNMATAHLEFDSASIVPGRNITWKVKTFVISSSTTANSHQTTRTHQQQDQQNFNFNHQDYHDDHDFQYDEPRAEARRIGSGKKSDGKNNKSMIDDKNGHGNIGAQVFNPRCILELCDFLSSHKPLAIVNLIGDAGSERLLSLLSTYTALPLIGATEFAQKLQSKEAENDYYVNLSTSVQDFARALGLLLLYCHWHTFSVIFDDSPQILSNHLIWEEELSSGKWNRNGNHEIPTNFSSSELDYEEYAGGGGTGQPYSSTEEHHPTLNPNFITIRTKSSNSAFRALSEISKGNQGVVVLLCSQASLIQVFRAAKLLRMLNGEYVFILIGHYSQFEVIPDWVPNGILALRAPRHAPFGKSTMKATGKLLGSAFSSVKNLPIPTLDEGSPVFPVGNYLTRSATNLDLKSVIDSIESFPNVSCWNKEPYFARRFVSSVLTREIRRQMELFSSSPANSELLRSGMSMEFDILNLVKPKTFGQIGKVLKISTQSKWTNVGNVSLDSPEVKLDTIRWPGGGISGPGLRKYKAYRVVTIISPPFVMEGYAEENKTCVKGLPCLKVKTNDKDELALIFADLEKKGGGGDGDPRFELVCCDGLSMDLLTLVARELKFEIDLYLIPDGYYGEKMNGHWNGIMAALTSGAAELCFGPFSVTSNRATAIDFSTPYFYSSIGMLGLSRNRDAPLFAFLSPFAPELWIAIIIALNITAVVVAIYEWISPFGLNPWGRMRTKNFSMASALWVVWGRLFSHLVAFKAPKSWPNKFLINVWGGFSVIFVASYTANIAALFAGMFFERTVDVRDRSLLSIKVASVKHTATDFYLKSIPHLREHTQAFQIHSFADAIKMLKNGSLDVVIGDSGLLDFYRGTDPSCSLIDVSAFDDKIGDDTYAIAMTKGFPLRDSISSIVSKLQNNGHMDYLQGKWYSQMPCFAQRTMSQTSHKYFYGARALGVEAVTGMLIVLGLGMVLGFLILLLELLVYKYALPYFRNQPKGTLWRSPNLMFFSQKLYRFINCVELVSPHHAAKELVNSLKKGQITSLFQKSVKRKERENVRRRKSKAQFFNMIQEIRRVQKAGGSFVTDTDSSNDEKIVMQNRAGPVYTIVGQQGQGPGPGSTGSGSVVQAARPYVPQPQSPYYYGQQLQHQQQQMMICRSRASGGGPASVSAVSGWVGSRSSGNLLERFDGHDDLTSELNRHGAGRTPMMRRPPGSQVGHQHHHHHHHAEFSRSNSGSRRYSQSGRYSSGPQSFADSDEDDDEVLTVKSEKSMELETLSKGQLIEMWRKSELELKRRLADACRVNQNLNRKLTLMKNTELGQPP